LKPANINTGITIVGKRARVPVGAIIGETAGSIQHDKG